MGLLHVWKVGSLQFTKCCAVYIMESRENGFVTAEIYSSETGEWSSEFQVNWDRVPVTVPQLNLLRLAMGLCIGLAPEVVALKPITSMMVLQIVVI